MTTIIIDENTEEGRSLMNIIRAMKRSPGIQIIDEDNPSLLREEAIPYGTAEVETGRIPGLAYTDEERIASVNQAIEDYQRTGKYYTTEELRAKHPRL